MRYPPVYVHHSQVTADHELEPMSRSLLAAPHSMCELKAQLAKTVITVVDVLLWDYPRVQGVVFMMCCVSTFYFHIKQVGGWHCEATE